MGPISWAGRAGQVEATINAVQEGCQAITEAFVKKRTKARGPGCPHKMTKVMRIPTTAYIKEWMLGMEEDAPKGEVRNGNVVSHRPEQRNAHSQCTGQGSRWHRRQGRPQFPRDTSVGSPSSGVGILIWGSN